MGKHRKLVPITRRARKNDDSGVQKRRSREYRTQGSTARPWSCASVVDKQAAGIIGKVLGSAEKKSRGVNLRSLTLAAGVRSKKATHAVVCQTLKFLPTLKQIVKTSGLLETHAKLRPSVAYVLVYEVLIGEGCKPNGPAERAILRAEDGLKATLQQHLTDMGVETVGDLEPDGMEGVPKDRYVRVNTLKMSVTKAEKIFAKDFEVVADSLLPDVLRFPPNTDLHDHPLVENGSVILQGYGSCMCAHALSPGKKWHVLDACAAPGNKTTHIAALMGGKGKILAIDKDGKRLEKLALNVEKTGARNVSIKEMDFLSFCTDEEPGLSVEGILLDPSCSGSGTASSRMDHLLPVKGDEEQDRIKRLADFQAAALKHALSFPNVQRIVYSTCSLHTVENEEVVQCVLPFAKQQGFKIKDPFPKWHRRGLSPFKECEKMVRTDVEDAMDGFFLVLFERNTSVPNQKQSDT